MNQYFFVAAAARIVDDDRSCFALTLVGFGPCPKSLEARLLGNMIYRSFFPFLFHVPKNDPIFRDFGFEFCVGFRVKN